MDLLIFIIILNLRYKSSCILYWPVSRTTWLITLTGDRTIICRDWFHLHCTLIYRWCCSLVWNVSICGYFFSMKTSCLVQIKKIKKARCDQIGLTDVVQALVHRWDGGSDAQANKFVSTPLPYWRRIGVDGIVCLSILQIGGLVFSSFFGSDEICFSACHRRSSLSTAALGAGARWFFWSEDVGSEVVDMSFFYDFVDGRRRILV
jgi:hypothetical protein